MDLQYGDVDEDVAELKAFFGNRFITFRDQLDLKQDIEGNLALMSYMDLVAGPAISTQSFAMALGKETRILLRGRPWWSFSKMWSRERVPGYHNLRILSHFDTDGDDRALRVRKPLLNEVAFFAKEGYFPEEAWPWAH